MSTNKQIFLATNMLDEKIDSAIKEKLVEKGFTVITKNEYQTMLLEQKSTSTLNSISDEHFSFSRLSSNYRYDSYLQEKNNSFIKKQSRKNKKF